MATTTKTPDFLLETEHGLLGVHHRMVGRHIKYDPILPDDNLLVEIDFSQSIPKFDLYQVLKGTELAKRTIRKKIEPVKSLLRQTGKWVSGQVAKLSPSKRLNAYLAKEEKRRRELLKNAVTFTTSE